MSRTRRYLRGMGVGYAHQLLSMGVGLYLTRFLLERLGSEQYGLWIVGMQLLGWLLLLDVGVVALVPREIAISTGRADDPEATSRLVGFSARLALMQTVLVGVAALVLWLLLPSDWDALRPALGPTLLAFVLQYPLRLLPALLEGLQDLAWQSGAQMVAFLLGNATTVGLVLLGHGLVALAWGWIVQQGVVAVLAGWRLWRHHRHLLPRRLPVLAWSEVVHWLRRGAWISVDKLATLLVSGTDLLLVGKLLGPEATVAYACTGKAVSILIHQPRMLVNTALPGLSQMRTGESRERLLHVTTGLTQATLLVSGLLATGVVAANGAFVGWWVGADKHLGLAVTVLFALNMTLRHLANATALATFCFGDERRIALTTLVDGSLAFVLGAVGLKLFGFIGAPLGTLAGLVLVSLPGHLRALARHSGTSVGQLLRPLAPWGLRTGALMVLGAAAALFWSPDHFPGLVALSAAAALLYLVVVGPVAFRGPLEAYVRPRWNAVLARMPARWVARAGSKPSGSP
ncbi:lipopolysaccharide biosynthesis protein [Archangium violaceum]|uniref:lipopolysaccharide biosynthesis protein n=1 Tax=Archangium violaceum TaxID=83451 RepID=UPI00194FD4E3|nr:lipopolysaccharide biosynthesis protein [Archangium violaceum]QRN95957.1 lipopolysaccharide biosynthesis protein [Archangium violaceum]